MGHRLSGVACGASLIEGKMEPWKILAEKAFRDSCVYVDYIHKSKYGCLGIATLNRGSMAFLKHSDRLRVMGFKCNMLDDLPQSVRLDRVWEELVK